MKISLKPHHLKIYQRIASLLLKYGRSDLVQDLAVADVLKEEDLRHERGTISPEELASDLEQMGPTFVKLGQILSGRPDLLTEPYLKALSRLQDKVKPFGFDEVEQTIVSELGVRLSKAFNHFDEVPLAAASPLGGSRVRGHYSERQGVASLQSTKSTDSSGSTMSAPSWRIRATRPIWHWSPNASTPGPPIRVYSSSS